MKNCILLLLLSVTMCSFAQKTGSELTSSYKKGTCRSSFVKANLLAEETPENVSSYLIYSISNLKGFGVGLQLQYRKESPGGIHYSFQQTFKGICIYQSEIKVNLDKQNIIHSVFDNSENTLNWNIDVLGANNNSVILLHPKTQLPVLAQRTVNSQSEEVFSVLGEIIFTQSLRVYFNTDSAVSGTVFNPDPLTTAQQLYSTSTPYFDNNDAANTQLDAQMQTVSFKATFDGNVFTLESPFVRVQDFDVPNIAPVMSSAPFFNFNRSQSGFEDVNAFYHISNLQQHIHSLGFYCADSLVDIDPHAVGGSDNSYYSPASYPNRIYYGTGGVDDAEDADVCVHEYGHFVSATAAPSSNYGQQRNALDEAFGDYLAASYSKNLSGYNSNWVFNWDGHNEFWNGRVMNTTRVYPNDLQSSIYKNGEIWSAALFAIHNEIGRKATDSLILQTHYSYAQNISMADAAQLLIDADTLLNNGAYFCPIYKHLLERGFVSFYPTNPCGISTVDDASGLNIQFMSQPNSFTLLNPEKQEIQIQIVSLTGQVVSSSITGQEFVERFGNSLSSSVYLIVVKTAYGTKSFKWCKSN